MTERTPATRTGMRQYDHLPALDAVIAAWVKPGRSPRYHRAKQAELRATMPVLARALDRLASDPR